MDFQDAFRVSKQLEKIYAPELIVVGFRRQELRDVHSWAVDIANPSTAQMITIDERDDIHSRIERIRSPVDAQRAGRAKSRSTARNHGATSKPEVSSTDELVHDREALERWNGEGGDPADSYGALEEIDDKLERRRG